MPHFSIFPHVFTVVCLCICMCVCVWVIVPRDRTVKGTWVWISSSIAGVRERVREWSKARCFHGNPLIWRDADMEGHGVTGGLPGRWVNSRKWPCGQEQRGFPIKRNDGGLSLSNPPVHLYSAHTCKQTHILGDTNNSWHIEILRCAVSTFTDAESWGWPPLFPCPTFSLSLSLARNSRHH